MGPRIVFGNGLQMKNRDRNEKTAYLSPFLSVTDRTVTVKHNFPGVLVPRHRKVVPVYGVAEYYQAIPGLRKRPRPCHYKGPWVFLDTIRTAMIVNILFA
jgi:hypothetical protein